MKVKELDSKYLLENGDRFNKLLNKYKNSKDIIDGDNYIKIIYVAENVCESTFLKLFYINENNSNEFKVSKGYFITRFRYNTVYDKNKYKKLRKFKKGYISYNEYVKFSDEYFESNKENK